MGIPWNLPLAQRHSKPVTYISLLGGHDSKVH